METKIAKRKEKRMERCGRTNKPNQKRGRSIGESDRATNIKGRGAGGESQKSSLKRTRPDNRPHVQRTLNRHDAEQGVSMKKSGKQRCTAEGEVEIKGLGFKRKEQKPAHGKKLVGRGTKGTRGLLAKKRGSQKASEKQRLS